MQPDLEIPKQGINDSADAEVHRLNFSCIPQTVCGSPPCSTRSSSRGVLHSTHKQDPSSLRLLASSAQDPRKLHRANHPPSLELTWAPRLQTSQPLRTRARAPRPGERGDLGAPRPGERRGPGSSQHWQLREAQSWSSRAPARNGNWPGGHWRPRPLALAGSAEGRRRCQRGGTRRGRRSGRWLAGRRETRRAESGRQQAQGALRARARAADHRAGPREQAGEFAPW